MPLNHRRLQWLREALKFHHSVLGQLYCFKSSRVLAESSGKDANSSSSPKGSGHPFSVRSPNIAIAPIGFHSPPHAANRRSLLRGILIYISRGTCGGQQKLSYETIRQSTSSLFKIVLRSSLPKCTANFFHTSGTAAKSRGIRSGFLQAAA